MLSHDQPSSFCARAPRPSRMTPETVLRFLEHWPQLGLSVVRRRSLVDRPHMVLPLRSIVLVVWFQLAEGECVFMTMNLLWSTEAVKSLHRSPNSIDPT